MPTGSVKNKADLVAQEEITVYPNGANLINGTDHQQFLLDLLASVLNRIDDELLLNLRDHSATRGDYKTGEGAYKNRVLYRALQITSGAFNPSHFQVPIPVLPALSYTEMTDLITLNNQLHYMVHNSDDNIDVKWNVTDQQWVQF